MAYPEKGAPNWAGKVKMKKKKKTERCKSVSHTLVCVLVSPEPCNSSFIPLYFFQRGPLPVRKAEKKNTEAGAPTDDRHLVPLEKESKREREKLQTTPKLIPKGPINPYMAPQSLPLSLFRYAFPKCTGRSPVLKVNVPRRGWILRSLGRSPSEPRHTHTQGPDTHWTVMRPEQDPDPDPKKRTASVCAHVCV